MPWGMWRRARSEFPGRIRLLTDHISGASPGQEQRLFYIPV